jgi:hypothetical protein
MRYDSARNAAASIVLQAANAESNRSNGNSAANFLSEWVEASF